MARLFVCIFLCLAVAAVSCERFHGGEIGAVEEKDKNEFINRICGMVGPKCDSCVNGTNGLDGRDGIDGADGLQGDPGVSGRDGKDGKDGTNGVDGRDGVNGRNGRNAAKKNWKECAWNYIDDDKDIGLIKSCHFKKKSATSYLKVRVTTDMRLRNCFQCCKRWYVTFNGKECSPVAIDGIVYIEVPKANVHRPRTIGGHCKIPETGNINVGLHIGNCAGYGNADGYTGWRSTTHFFVEEVVPPQA